MKPRYKILIFFLLAVGFFIFYKTVLADSIFGGLEGARKTAGFSEGTSIESQVGNVISIVLGFVGIIFLGLILYGGLIWMIARGNEQEIEKAKNLITSAVIGLAIVLAAYAITYFVIQRLIPAPGTGGVTCTAEETPCACPGGTFCMDTSAWSGCDAFCAGEEP
jgi:hypothetical protein